MERERYQSGVEIRWINARETRQKGLVEEEKWLVYGVLWHAAISSLNLQCGCDGLREGEAVK